jgi:RNA polymerase sigma-70 factor (ECF subfamily)
LQQAKFIAELRDRLLVQQTPPQDGYLLFRSVLLPLIVAIGSEIPRSSPANLTGGENLNRRDYTGVKDLSPLDLVQISAASAAQDTGPVSEDAQLVQAVLRKDRKATALFVERYADAIYGYVRSRLAPRVDLADDLVQDIFIAAWEALDSFRGTSSLRSWLLGVARHKVEDYYRARLCDLVEEPGDVDTIDLSAADFDEELDRKRLEEKMQQVLRQLPEHYSLLLLWRYWDKVPVREIASKMGRTEKAIERMLARARDHFERRWNDV